MNRNGTGSNYIIRNSEEYKKELEKNNQFPEDI